MLFWQSLSIIVSVFIVTIAVGVTDRPAAAPEGRFDLGITAGVPGSFVEALSALTTFAFSYGGLPAFICIIPEMQNPNDFNKSMFVSQVNNYFFNFPKKTSINVI